MKKQTGCEWTDRLGSLAQLLLAAIKNSLFSSNERAVNGCWAVLHEIYSYSAWVPKRTGQTTSWHRASAARQIANWHRFETKVENGMARCDPTPQKWTTDDDKIIGLTIYVWMGQRRNSKITDMKMKCDMLFDSRVRIRFIFHSFALCGNGWVILSRQPYADKHLIVQQYLIGPSHIHTVLP